MVTNNNKWQQLALCTAVLLPELKPAPCFLSDIIGLNWLIQVCLTLVVMATIIRHTWINQVWPIISDRSWPKFRK